MIPQEQTIFEEGQVQLAPQLQQIENTPMQPQEYQELVNDAYKEGVKESIKNSIVNHGRDPKIQGKQEGQKEQMKEAAKNAQIAEQKMENLTKRADILIFKADTLFPFDPFPDTITIDTSKVSIIHRNFIASEQVTTMLLKEITDVSMESSLILANLKFTYAHSPMSAALLKTEILKLKRSDALQVKEIIEGILVAQREGIDISQVSPEKMASFIKNLGKSKDKKADAPQPAIV